MTASATFPIRELPNAIVPDEWRLLVMRCGSEGAALAALDRVQLGAGQFEALADGIVARLRELALAGAIQGMGRYTANDQIQTIPAERWRGAFISFAEDLIANLVPSHDPFHDSYHRYHSLRITVVSWPPRPSLEQRIEGWLRGRQTSGSSELKKVLRDNARQEFGSEFRERAFNGAYDRIFQRSRGRPPKPKR